MSCFLEQMTSIADPLYSRHSENIAEKILVAAAAANIKPKTLLIFYCFNKSYLIHLYLNSKKKQNNIV
jgi:hypothetical protein